MTTTSNQSSPDSKPTEASTEPWGWNRTQRIALGSLLLIFLTFLLIQFARRPARLDDPVVTYNSELVTLPTRIDPNTATLQELSRIPHLGESLAATTAKDATTNAPSARANLNRMVVSFSYANVYR